MRNRILVIVVGVFLFLAGYLVGNGRSHVAFAQAPAHGGIPKSYGHLVTAVVNPNGTSLVFEDEAGIIRLVTITGQLEGEFTRN